MASTSEELRSNIREAVEAGYRQQLLARGQARGMIWRAGELPIDAPNFSPLLSEDLLSFGYSLLLHGLRYLDLGGDFETARQAFEVAAESIEAVVARGQLDETRDFHRLVAASAYHLGRFSARAYSLLRADFEQANLSVVERCLAQLVLRDLAGVNRAVASWFESGAGSDDNLMAALDPLFEVGGQGAALEDGEGVAEALLLGLEGNFMSAMSQTLLALERGEQHLIGEAQARLRQGLSVAGDMNFVGQWWVHRLALYIVDSLWSSSFHAILPMSGPDGAAIGDWESLRKLFITSLLCRGRSEIELWPSQIEAAKRVLEYDANLVLSLPTSAGKTRIAELCILACLALGTRVVFVTPLRALSAQTEVSLRRTFSALGKSVSSLYGSIGASSSDVDTLKSRDIVVSTPEKLDFALRSDPTLLDDVGLVVLDEGHMIGLGEREVRYEAQVQRLLRRPDAASRRIVCLSAILPDGDQLADFTAWLTADRPDGLIKNGWRPTRLRFGEVDWNPETKVAQLNVVVGDEHPFIPKFVVGKRTSNRANAAIVPGSQTDLCIFTAWRLIEDGQSVLVFCPIRVSVMPFAKRIIKLSQGGLLPPIMTPPVDAIASALAVGAEWFGPDHDILKCLRMGVAVHHGELPTQFRKEVEHLLRDGILKLTVSSPTLAQGLNLAATSLILHGHSRHGEAIDESEFRNVVGRAGRAYVDIEGLVLYPMFDEHEKRRDAWKGLIRGDKQREMESGIFRLLYWLLDRMARKIGTRDVDALLAYVAGQGAWSFAAVPGERKRLAEAAVEDWPRHLTSLDTAIFSLLGDAQVADEELESKIDEVLTSSLLTRRLARRSEGVQRALLSGLKARAKLIWTGSTAVQRRGYFLAGVGLETGRMLDEKADELEFLLLRADTAVDGGEVDEAVKAIVAFAEIAFEISPFTPKSLPPDWRKFLDQWLRGAPVHELGDDDADDAISLIEHAFVYNLPWAMEAVRVRAQAHAPVGDPFDLDIDLLPNLGSGSAVAAVETGTLSIPAAVLIKAGFASRLGAISAVLSTGADFDDAKGLRAWLASDTVLAWSVIPTWPTENSHELWREFTAPHGAGNVQPWTTTEYTGPVQWKGGVPMPPGMPLRIAGSGPKVGVIYSSDYRELGRVRYPFSQKAVGLTVATSNGGADQISFEYTGPNDLIQS
ncbi:DEAD/DEAH box helicase [Aquincola sp. S2]|uniref:DEAD/DEAH box helicase n=1 Tax=Pseudaquabacterium terrae TaxID=2732868 RepID=A0ABX2EES2_9BURK|nr:DEAD/DEAH box helicase [Aquabacterium terrae]NRF67103.1 DEAD/DEAH box helicase [Aquabacterium terrae]